MNKRKNLLNEATVRRFQTLAAIPGLRESRGREDLEEGKDDEDDDRDELDEMMGEYDDDMSSIMEAEEEEEDGVE